MNSEAAKQNYAHRRNDREPRCEDASGISRGSCPACSRFLQAYPRTPAPGGWTCYVHRCEAIWSVIHSRVEAGERTAGTLRYPPDLFIAFLNDIPGRHGSQCSRHRPVARQVRTMGWPISLRGQAFFEPPIFVWISGLPACPTLFVVETGNGSAAATSRRSAAWPGLTSE